jgi:hypothetical protein
VTIPLPTRQHLLLALLDAVGGSSNNRDFQELLFLFSQEHPTAGLYEFVPCRYGAFSFTSYADRRELTAAGMLEDNEASWDLTEGGRYTVGGQYHSMVQTFVSEFGNLRGDTLAREAYRRYPWFATRSEIADQILQDDPDTIRRIHEARRCKVHASLLSIGYQGRSLEGYLNEIMRAGVSQLCDVRRNPNSRQYGFSKPALDLACQSVGIIYRHLPELGVSNEGRRNLKTQADYDALYESFVREGLPEQRKILADIAAWVRAGDRIALTCYDRDPGRSHRRCIAGVLEKDFGISMPTVHL